ncbi:unnamed protein product [Rangifer tarandus platyrhynchus]|uniref:Uncharacterized protein n=2 Tax=Rangifer tarandus platyrhynchus TaxID=3082113 RepID=A0AC59ZG39_RANTA|nr:unnamed protein product [Rangifer tarandus platyrhynchus]
MKSMCVTAKSSPHLPQLEKARARQQRPSGAPNQSINQYNYKKESFKKNKGNTGIGLLKWENQRDLLCYIYMTALKDRKDGSEGSAQTLTFLVNLHVWYSTLMG